MNTLIAECCQGCQKARVFGAGKEQAVQNTAAVQHLMHRHIDALGRDATVLKFFIVNQTTVQHTNTEAWKHRSDEHTCIYTYTI